MGRARNPSRDEAKKKWLDSGGKISTRDLATAIGVPDYRISKWKSEDKWQQELDIRKQGGQRGNKNAAGHGAPADNKNAETHGAYSRVHLDGLTHEEQEYIESLTIDTKSAMLREYQLLMAKERDLTHKIKEYDKAAPDTLYVDRVVETLTPKSKEENGGGKRGNKEDLKTSTRTVIKASPFDRAMKLEAEHNKLHGRILKLIDSMRAQGIDVKRLNLDERKHTLTKQRLSGEYNIDPATGEINDTESAEDVDTDI